MAFLDSLSTPEGPPAGFGQGYCWVATQPQAGVSAVEADSLCPGLRESPLDFGWFDQQTDPMAASGRLHNVPVAGQS